MSDRARTRVPFRLGVISDGSGDGERLLAILGTALKAAPAGAVFVQLRERTLGGAALYDLGTKLRALTTAHGAGLFINDRVDVALAVGADGVHLPTHGLPIAAARRTIAAAKSSLLISAACHSLTDAQAADAAGADLITLGPIFATPSKSEGPLQPGQERVHPIGTAALAQVAAAVSIPVFALGGIDGAQQAAECKRAGARLACIRAVLNAPNPASAIQSLLA